MIGFYGTIGKWAMVLDSDVILQVFIEKDDVLECDVFKCIDDIESFEDGAE